MTQKFPPINPKYPHILHGADYNPEQWIDTPDIWGEDMRLMKLAHCNVMAVGIFSWIMLEPEEGVFNFEWLDQVLDKLADNGIYAVLATPSGAKPAWMGHKYPEIRRVLPDGRREPQQWRHNHCYTSPLYREKTSIINTRLAERYGDHPALLVWHVSNEYGGECHCALCYTAFRQWLKKRYGSLEALNRAWWSTFWSHRYTAWEQIEPVDPSVHGLMLDWKRFVTDQTVDFFRHEIKPLKQITPEIPVTANMMGTYPGLNYWKFAPYVDVISWDSYPNWHGPVADWELAADTGFRHDLNRSLKQGQPFMLMESVPSAVHWMDIGRPKRPGMHLLSSLQAVAHGSDTVQYFQWRKSRGSTEKFHGAVVDHAGHENTRVFRDVAELGRILKKLDPVVGTSVQPDVALVFDWENRWAFDMAEGPRNVDKDHDLTCLLHYRPFWQRGIPVDIIDMNGDFSPYKLLVAPMLYLLRPGVAERMEAFVEAGGVLVTTYMSGIVNETDLCFLGGFPGPLRRVLGIWVEETDLLHDHQPQSVRAGKNPLGLNGEYEVRHYADIVHLEGAEALAAYGHDFYAGQPALTAHNFGRGTAYYIASRNENRFLEDFYQSLIRELDLKQALKNIDLPEGTTAQVRAGGEQEFIFLLNFKPESQTIDLGDRHFSDLLTGETVTGLLNLAGYGAVVLNAAAE